MYDTRIFEYIWNYISLNLNRYFKTISVPKYPLGFEILERGLCPKALFVRQNILPVSRLPHRCKYFCCRFCLIINPMIVS